MRVSYKRVAEERGAKVERVADRVYRVVTKTGERFTVAWEDEAGYHERGQWLVWAGDNVTGTVVDADESLWFAVQLACA